MRKHRTFIHKTLFLYFFAPLFLAAAAPEQPAVMLRDPFWPVDWTPPKPKKKGEVSESKIKWPKLQLKGMTKASDGSYIAIIEGVGIVEPGQTVRKNQNGLIYRWKIVSITENGVSIKKLDVRK